MRVATIIAALATLAAASPKGYKPAKKCLTDKDAKELVDNTVKIYELRDPTELVLKYFTKDYYQYSDSTAFVLPPDIAPALGAPFTTSRAQFLTQHVNTQPPGPIPTFTVEDYFYSCNKITFRWVWNQPAVPVRGIDVLEVVHSKTGWRVKTEYVEFNNIALLANFGICPGGPCPNSTGAAETPAATPSA